MRIGPFLESFLLCLDIATALTTVMWNHIGLSKDGVPQFSGLTVEEGV